MDWIHIGGSLIKEVLYSDRATSLYVKTYTNMERHYEKVPKNLYEEMISQPTGVEKENYFKEHIREDYISYAIEDLL